MEYLKQQTGSCRTVRTCCHYIFLESGIQYELLTPTAQETAMTMITPSLVPSSDPLVTAASVLEFALGLSVLTRKRCRN